MNLTTFFMVIELDGPEAWTRIAGFLNLNVKC